MSVNKVILVGHVGKDPDVRHLDSGVTVAKFSLATNESYTDKSGEKKSTTEWHNIVVWRKIAEIAEKYVKSGSLLYVEGKLRTESFSDKDGNKRYFTNVLCENFRFLGGNKSESKENEVQTVVAEEVTPEPDDLPF